MALTSDWPTYAYPEDFSFVDNPSAGAFMGMVTIDDAPAEDGADIIAAFEPVGGICVGTGEMTSGGFIVFFAHSSH